MNVEKYIVKADISIKEAMKVLDAGTLGFLCVYKNDQIYGVITDGDIRRAILNNIPLESAIEKIANTKFVYVSAQVSDKLIDNIFKSKKIRQIPVVENQKLINILTYESFYHLTDEPKFEKIDAKVVIMAGGKGTRLLPLTQILPKPLIPIGEKSILEIIMDEFEKFGIKDFFISVNYKAALIKAYLEDIEKKYNLTFINEDKPLGTAGAIKFVQNKIEKPFFVSNCDIIVKSDYSQIYDFHIKGNYDITIVASMQNFKIPYGVCEISNGGQLIEIKEKPEYHFLVNTGMYVLSPHILELIPENEFFHITDLIEKVKHNGGKVGVYPISESSWIDIGQMEEYKKMLKNMNFD